MPPLRTGLALAAVGAGLLVLPLGPLAAQASPTSAPAPATQARLAAAGLRAGPRSVHLLTGVVRDPNGRPLGGVCVTAAGPDLRPSFAVTAADGRYEIAVPSVGTYRLQYLSCQTATGSATQAPAVRQALVDAGPLTMVAPVTLGPPTARSAFKAALAAAGVVQPDAVRMLTRAQHPGEGQGEPTGRLIGKVTAPSGRGLGNICVSLIFPGITVGIVTSGNGSYDFTEAPVGDVPIEFSSTCSFPLSGRWAPEWYKHVFALSSATKVRIRAGKATRGINAVMEPGGVISGEVTAPSGRKLSGVCVVLTTAKGVEVTQATTGANGAYRLTTLDPGGYRVLFVPTCGPKLADYGSVWWPDSTTLAKARPVSVRLGRTTAGISATLPRLATISGMIRLGGKTGRPLAGMCVTAYSPTSSFTQDQSANSRRNGSYAVEGLTPGTYEVEANPGCNNNGNYASATYPREIKVTAGKTVRSIDLYLQPGGILSGTVTAAATGKPLSGVCVSDDQGDFGITGRDGSYRIDQMTAGTITVAFSGGCGSKGSYASQYYSGQVAVEAANSVRITAGHTAGGISAAMQPGATITGRVTGTRGQKLTNVCVSAISPLYLGLPFDDLGAQAVSRNGTYTVANLDPGQYAVAFWAGCAFAPNAGAQQWFKAQPTFETAGLVSAPAGVTVAGIDATLAPAGSIVGTVTDPAGNPVGVACVTAVGGIAGPAGNNQALAFDAGYTLGGLAPGRYTVEASDCSGAGLESEFYHKAVVVRAGHSTGGINFALGHGGAIAGRITIRSTGAPARGVCVEAIGDGGAYTGYAATGADGRYRIAGLNTSRYRVTIQTIEGCQTGTENLASRSLAGTVRVTSGRTTSGVNAALGQGGTISGRITEAGTGAVAGACVEVFAQHSGQVIDYGSTGGSGLYTMSGLAPGRYRVLLGDPFCSDNAPGLGEQWFDGASSSATATAVTVTAGKTRSGVDAELGLDGTITGTVTGPASAPLTGICVSAVPVSGSVSTSYTVASGGSYTLPYVTPGRYRVEFQSGCGLTGWATQWWDGAGSRSAARVFTVGPDATISGIGAVMAKGG
jgi:Carboxypeptidase regulatory-like domain